MNFKHFLFRNQRTRMLNAAKSFALQARLPLFDTMFVAEFDMKCSKIDRAE